MHTRDAQTIGATITYDKIYIYTFNPNYNNQVNHEEHKPIQYYMITTRKGITREITTFFNITQITDTRDTNKTNRYAKDKYVHTVHKMTILSAK